MAAPPVTARTIPSGYKLPEGMKATIAFSKAPAISFWEETVVPGGIDSGGPIDTTTQFNLKWKTMAAKRLRKSEPVTGSAAYDPDLMTTIDGLVGDDSGAVTVYFPDGTQVSWWAYLDKVTFGELKEGEFPKLSYTIVITNFDKANQVEAGPVYTPASGT